MELDEGRKVPDEYTPFIHFVGFKLRLRPDTFTDLNYVLTLSSAENSYFQTTHNSFKLNT